MAISARTESSLLIGGEWRPATASSPVVNPTTGGEIGRMSLATPKDTIAAIERASETFPDWSRYSPLKRSRVLRRVAELLRNHKDRIARILSAETGKLIEDARAEINLSAEFFDWFAEEGRRARGELVPTPHPHKRALVLPRPIGVVAVLTPWNFPVSIQARKLAPALAAGCTIVSRPSSVAPLSVVELFSCLDEAGIPPGVCNLVTGEVASTCDLLLGHERIAAITFTGSTEVGRVVATRAAKWPVRTSLELGGNAPFIVFEDADLDFAVEQAMIAKYRNNGQSCIAMNRLLVHEAIAGQFIQSFVERSGELILGNPLEEGVGLGPVISEQARKRIHGWIAGACQMGGTLLLGGETSVPKSGFFVAPTLVLDAPPESELGCEEVFGPAVGIWKFRDEEDAVRLANSTPYGLIAYACTTDLERTVRVSEALRFGMVGINDATPTTPELPFGGIGLSGYGKEGGHQGLDEFVDDRYVSIAFKP